MKVKRKIFSNKATLALPYTLNLGPRGHEFIGKGHNNSAFSFFPPSESWFFFLENLAFFCNSINLIKNMLFSILILSIKEKT